MKSTKHLPDCIELTHRSKRSRSAFTLVELLVVTFILILLAGIALPRVREILKDGKATQNAREIVAFLNEARSRAIASGQEVGVFLARFGFDNNYERSFSNQMLLSNPMPPYSGETTSAKAFLFHEDASNIDLDNTNYLNRTTATLPSTLLTGITNAAFFPASDCPLLFLSAQNGGNVPSPIRLFDRLELQGGRTVVIRAMRQIPAATTGIGLSGPGTKVIFDPRGDLLDSTSQNELQANPSKTPTFAHPSSARITTQVRPVDFRIFREPIATSVGSLSLLKGMAVDFNYSGIGDNGIQFSPRVVAPSATDTSSIPCYPVAIVFAPDGSVSYMRYGVDIGNPVPELSREKPTSLIYFCVGETDGVRPDDLFATEDRAPANVMNPESIWITVNPATGMVNAAPPVVVDPPVFTSATPDAATINNAVREACRQSRALAVRAGSINEF